MTETILFQRHDWSAPTRHIEFGAVVRRVAISYQSRRSRHSFKQIPLQAERRVRFGRSNARKARAELYLLSSEVSGL